ncbi:unnamed protein product, partial [Rotaria sp. Silwood1]
KSGTNCLENFVIACGQHFTQNIWEKFCTCILEVFHSTLPEMLLTWRPESDSSAMLTIDEKTMLDRTDSSFDHTAVESPSSQHHRMTRANSSSSVNSGTSEQSEVNLNNRYSERTKTNSDLLQFQNLSIKCIVQVELIQTIDNIIFYPSTSKKEDLQYISIAHALASTPIGQENLTYITYSDDLYNDHGMYSYMSFDQLILLVDCLIESHMFARTFNSNNEQRNILWKAGYRGKAKPNLLTQETNSIACAFRILFRLYSDQKHINSHDILKRRILNLTRDCFEYYSTLQSETHRDAWTSVLMLILTKLLKFNEEQFKYYSIEFYSLISEIVVFDLKPELRYILREFLLRIGRSFIKNSDLMKSIS